LQSKGFSAAICQVCRADPSQVDAVGKLLDSGSASAADFICRPCLTYEKRKREEAMIASVGGPTPTEILQTIAASAPWYLTVRQASPEAMLTALNKLKRRTDFSATANELADGLASREVLPALLLQSLSKDKADPLCQKALESYVTSKCPSIKYKQLLLAEFGGSLDKARRHFTEQTLNPDMLVAALASERLFLMDWISKQSTPPQKRAAKHALGIAETPYEASEWLYCVFKSLSVRIKCTAARNDAATLLIKNWYIDHLVIAHNMMCRRVVQSAAASLRSLPSSSSHQMPEPVPKKARTEANTTKAKGKGKSNKPTTKDNLADQFKEGKMDYTRVPASIAMHIKPGLNPTQANVALRAALATNKDDTYALYKHLCRNCWAAGRGWVRHSLTACRQAGTPSALECPVCRNGQVHWTEHCPRSK
jgi:hypothetical protein